MFQEIISNLKLLGYAFMIFTCAYGANMAFSLWYNIKRLRQPFDESKLRDSIIKLGVFVIGLMLLCIAITTLPVFADTIGWPILEEYANLFTNIIMVTVFLTVTCKYIKEAFEKFKLIVSAGELPNSSTEAKND
ncbi:hypothetical protein [Clostridium aminobutyricum]|uniref:Uncharacterized protein n=1 Tax=Clostridium aminobutyricum TaxID=33953 RepID=A0A939D8Q6_CLOAM|nr:hypothetical protein [Clostridium aminobutyricum]MBN7773137.1 hypothetical protein [Clostridium aminobutyricum]